MDNSIDILQIKIDQARLKMPKETLEAIDAVNWKATILALHTEKGYSFTELEDLEIETELLLCGLLEPEQYPKELEKRMNIPKAQVDVLVNEMNEKIFKKIREELVKNIERKKISENKEVAQKINTSISDENGIESREELLKHIENPDLLNQKELSAGKTEEQKGELLKNSPRVPLGNSILSQKLGGSFQIPKTETTHTLNNLSKNSENEKSTLPKVDPYREPTE